MDVGKLIGQAIIDAQAWMSGIDQAISGLRDLSAAAAAVGAGVAAGIGGLAAVGVEVASSAGRATTALGVMMKDTEAAAAMMKDIRNLAAATPFESADLVAGAQSLMSMGFAAEEVIPTLTALGDAAAAAPAGMSAALPLIVRAFGQIRAKGVVSMEELQQLAENGVGAIGMLADSLGITTAEAMKRVSSGAIDAGTGLNALMQGIQRDLGGMMAAQSQTLDGVLSTLSDTFKNTLGDMAQPLVAALAAAVPVASDLSGAMLAGLEPFIAGMTSAVKQATAMTRSFGEATKAAQEMGVTTVASVGLAVGVVGALGYALTSVVEGVAAVTAAVAALEAVAAPLLVVTGVVIALGAAFYALFAYFGSDGENVLQFLSRMAGLLYDQIRPAVDAAWTASQAFIYGFLAGFGDITPLVAQVGAALAHMTSIAQYALSVLASVDWAAWYRLGSAIGAVASLLAGAVVDAASEVFEVFAAINDLFKPLIAGIARFGAGIAKLATGTGGLRAAFEDMATGISAIILSPFVALVSLILNAVSLLAGEMADIFSMVPGAEGIGAAFHDFADRAATAAEKASQTAADHIRGAKAATFNMEAEAGTVQIPGFDMEADAAAASAARLSAEMSGAAGAAGDYGNALAHLAGQAEGAAKTGKAAPVDTFWSDAGAAMISAVDEIDSATQKAAADMQAALADFVAFARAQVTGQAATGGTDIGGAVTAAADAAAAGRDYLAGQATGIVSAAASDLAGVIAAGVEGFAAAGPMGAVAGALSALLMSSESFGNLSAALGVMFQGIVTALDPIVKGIGMLLIAGMQNFGTVLKSMSPLFGIIGRIIGMMAPALMALGGALQALGFVFSTVAAILEPIMPIVEFAFRVFYEVMRAISLVILSVMWAIGMVWNAILDAILAVLNVIQKVFGGMKKAMESIEAMKMDTDGAADAMNDLMHSSYDSAYATAEAAAQTAMMGEAAQAATESLLNVPSGYKVALARYEATAAQTTMGAASGMGSGSGTTIIVESMTIAAQNPEDLMEQMAAASQTAVFRKTGIALARQAPRFSGSGTGGS